MSPYDTDSFGYAYVFYVRSNGNLNGSGYYYVAYAYGVRPVINLKADTLFTGSGTTDSPFEVVS